MKAIETQLKMKRLQVTKINYRCELFCQTSVRPFSQETRPAKIKVLDTARGMVGARRRLISEAISQQREITERRQRLAKEELDRRKELDRERTALVEQVRIFTICFCRRYIGYDIFLQKGQFKFVKLLLGG